MDYRRLKLEVGDELVCLDSDILELRVLLGDRDCSEGGPKDEMNELVDVDRIDVDEVFRFPLTKLPNELLFGVFSELTNIDLDNLLKVCRHTRLFLSDKSEWIRGLWQIAMDNLVNQRRHELCELMDKVLEEVDLVNIFDGLRDVLRHRDTIVWFEALFTCETEVEEDLDEDLDEDEW